ncbi:MAG: hypothetical protein AAF570_01115, partial [Bacteroidota bacterium]
MATSATNSSKSPGFIQKNKVALILAGLLVISNLGIYFYQKYQRGKLIDAYAEDLVTRGTQARNFVEVSLLQQTEELMRTIVWGVRGEMMRGNKELIDRYLIKLGQETQVDLVMIEDSARKIILSTDKKYENQDVREILPAVPTQVEKPRVLSASMTETIAASPIMGDDVRLG